MSEKVVLTQEQINAIELWLKNYQDKDQLLMIQFFVKVKEADASNEGWIGDYKPMKELSIAQLARAIHVGYEVEKPQFKNGDFLIRKNGERFECGSCVDLFYYYDEEVSYVVLQTGWRVPAEEVRLANEEEIYWMYELNRYKVGDFKYNDVFVDEDGESHLLKDAHPADGYRGLNDAEFWYESGNFKGIYPAESFKPFQKEAE